MRLELLQTLIAVVDERKAGALPATVLRLETEAGNGVLGSLVEFRKLLAELVFGNVGAVRVEDVAGVGRCVSWGGVGGPTVV